MFIPDAKERYKAYHVLITTNDKTFDSKSKAFNFYKLNTGFNGYVTVLNSKNEITDFDNYQDLKLVSKPKKNKLTPNTELTCIWYGYLDEDGQFHKISLEYCYEEPGSGGGEIFYGTGGEGGTGGGSGSAVTENDTALCEASLSDITGQAFSTSDFVSAKLRLVDSNTRNVQYSWKIFNCLDFNLYSYETGMHKKVANINPSLEWEWVSLTHNNIASTGFVVGVDMSYIDISHLPTVGQYNALMSLNYSVKFSLACKGSPVANELSFPANHIFNIND